MFNKSKKVSMTVLAQVRAARFQMQRAFELAEMGRKGPAQDALNEAFYKLNDIIHSN
jgi:hypothetical protein